MSTPLLDWKPEHHARRSDPETSHASARQAKELAGEHHRKILAALQSGPGHAEEIADLCGLQTHQVGRRIKELISTEQVEVTGTTRKNRSGRMMRVVRARI